MTVTAKMKYIPKALLGSLCIISCVFAGPTLLLHASSAEKKSKDNPRLVSPESVQGCYELMLSDWKPNSRLGEDAAIITPPHRVQFFAQRVKGRKQMVTLFGLLLGPAE
jgi:hypothetical protein